MIIYNASLNEFRNHVTLNLMSNILLENLRLKGLSGGSPSEVNVWNNFRIANQSVKKRIRHRINPKTANHYITTQIGTIFLEQDFSQPPKRCFPGAFWNPAPKPFAHIVFLFGQRVYYGWSQEQFLGITEVREINPAFLY